MKKIYKKKRRTRKILLQMLYSLNFSSFAELNFESTVLYKINKNKLDYSYLNFVFTGILQKQRILNFIVDYNFGEYKYFNLIDKLIIEMAVFDILFNSSIPWKVIINESIELSKLFSSKSSYIFINKILNNVIKGYIFNKMFI